MARVNVGIQPVYLADQHLIAESVEITMITGGLRANDFEIKSDIPPILNLGKGHINFFKDKLLYLYKRLEEVNMEMSRRNFRPGTYIDLDLFPSELCNDWTPSLDESLVLRGRVVDRLHHPKKGQDGRKYYRYERTVIGDELTSFGERIIQSELYYV